MNEVQKMSIFSGKKSNTSSNTNSIISGGDDTFPCLKLGTYDLIISSYSNLYLQGGRYIKDKSGEILSSQDGKSNIHFTYFYKNFGASPAEDEGNIQDHTDVLVLGILCEVLCKVGVPLKALQENATLVEEFVNKTFEYCGYAGYHFSLDKAINFLSNDFSGDSGSKLKSFVLLGRTEDKSLSIKARLDVDRHQITLQYGKDESNSIAIPYSLAYSFIELPYSDYLYTAIIWFLLARNGFYIEKDLNTFSTFEQVPGFKYPPIAIYGDAVFDPFNVNIIFASSQRC